MREVEEERFRAGMFVPEYRCDSIVLAPNRNSLYKLPITGNTPTNITKNRNGVSSWENYTKQELQF